MYSLYFMQQNFIKLTRCCDKMLMHINIVIFLKKIHIFEMAVIVK